MKRIQSLFAALAAASLLIGCSKGEPSKPESVATLVKQSEGIDRLDGKALARWMESTAQSSVQASPEGYAIDIDRKEAGFQTIWCFEQEDWIYYVQDLQNPPGLPVCEAVSLARTDGKKQTNINLSLDGTGVISSTSFERDPYWSTADFTYQRQPLVDVLSADGVEILRAFPDQFSGSLHSGDDGWTITWIVPDPDALLQALSGSRFAKSGFSAHSGRVFSWSMNPDGIIETIETVDGGAAVPERQATVRSLAGEEANKARIAALFDKYPIES